jgi:hypothetical protein
MLWVDGLCDRSSVARWGAACAACVTGAAGVVGKRSDDGSDFLFRAANDQGAFQEVAVTSAPLKAA